MRLEGTGTDSQEFFGVLKYVEQGPPRKLRQPDFSSQAARISPVFGWQLMYS